MDHRFTDLEIPKQKTKQAIALEYDPGYDAPKILATGKGVLAERIIEYRTEFGSFYDVGELREIKGIGDKLLRELLPYICV